MGRRRGLGYIAPTSPLERTLAKFWRAVQLREGLLMLSWVSVEESLGVAAVRNEAKVRRRRRRMRRPTRRRRTRMMRTRRRLRDGDEGEGR